MKKKYKLGIIGCGFMGLTILEGILKSDTLSKDEIIVSNRTDTPFSSLKKLGVSFTLSNKEVAENSEYILLAIKPQQLEEVLDSFDKKTDYSIISILAGIKKSKIQEYLQKAKVVRCMPNTPCSIGFGMVCIDSSDFSEDEQKFIFSIFNSLGEVLEIKEEKMNAVTGVSGSGPAYVYLFLSGLIKAGVKQGLSEDEARTLAVSTVIGGANMVKVNKNKTLEELTQSVCSKGGTTIEAVNTFKENKFENIIDKSVEACVNKAKILGGEEIKTFDIANNNEVVEIYTDGACSNNPGEGGWCAILIKGTKYKEISGGEINTTNNRMELRGVIEGLKALKKSCKVKLHSDSSYVINAFIKGWVKNWDKNGWKNSEGKEVKNIDLWEQLLTLTSIHEVEFIKVKGHADNKYNNRCDELAVAEWKKLKI